MPNKTTADHRRLVPYAIVALSFVVAVLLTVPVSMGDSTVFVTSVAARLEGRNYFYWDFGHLLWRPAGTLLAGGLLSIASTTEPFTAALRTMAWLNLGAGLGSSLLVLAILRRMEVRVVPATGLAIAFIFTHAVITYTQTTTAYLPGMFFLLAGLYLGIRAAGSERPYATAVAAGVSAALSAGMWFTFVFAIPSVAAAAGWLGRKPGIRPALAVLAGAAATGIAVFVGTALGLGITTPAEFIVWMNNAGHDISGIGGLPRTLLGFGRSFLYVGDDGSILRRFLNGDPHNPVTLLRAAATRVWLLGVIWLLGGLVIWRFIRSRENAVLAVFASAAVPVFTFAVLWQGGDVARYFPLYPCLFLLLGVFMNGRVGGKRLQTLVALGLLLMAVNNVAGLSFAAANARKAEAVARLSSLSGRAQHDDVVYSSHGLDEVLRYGGGNPLEPLVDDKRLQYRYLVLFGTPEIEEWRTEFARRVQRTWADGRQVWVANRLLKPVPQPEWNWIEGSDPRIEWRDFAEFFGQFEFTDPTNDDGFAQLHQTPTNVRLIELHSRNTG